MLSFSTNFSRVVRGRGIHCKIICDDVKVQNPLGVTSKSYKNPLGIVGHLVLALHKVKRKQEEIVLTGKYGIFER